MRTTRLLVHALVTSIVALAGCGSPSDAPGQDSGTHDAGGAQDAGIDSGAHDAGAPADAGIDAGALDGGAQDDAAVDGSRPDGGNTLDAGPSDGGRPLRLFAVARDDIALRVLDLATGATLETIPIVYASAPDAGMVGGATGLAVHPSTGVMYVSLRESMGSDEPSRTRHLATLDPTTGATVDIGLLPDGTAGLAFDAAGTLYAVTGERATDPETLFTIDLADASATLFLALGAGDDGEAIAYDSSATRLIHASGNLEHVLESIDLATMDITPIALTGRTYKEPTALTWDPSTGDVVGADSDYQLFTVSASGIATNVSTVTFVVRGLAFAP